jgi:uracil-DNA glycosylase family 4
MRGFFEIEKEIVRKKVNKKKIGGCESCKAYMDCQNPKLGVVGNGDKSILIVGAPPSEREDQSGKLLSNIQGKYLKHALQKINIDLERDCWYVPSVRCFSEDWGGPSTQIINSCKYKLHKTIKQLNPKKIITLGELPLEILLGDRCNGRMSLKPTEKFYGTIIPDQELHKLVMPNYDINFVLQPLKKRRDSLKKWGKWKSSDDKIVLWKNEKLCEYDDFILKEKFFIKYLKNILSKKEFRKDTYESECCTVMHEEDATHVLKCMQKESLVSFDYEASGIKLQKKGHKIYCVSFSNGIVSYGFPIFYDNKPFMDNLKRLLQSNRVGKISHNMAYEYQASISIFGYRSENFVWDTMLVSHILDNRSNITGLKVQTYMRFGILGYDSMADSYIKSTKEEKALYGANGFNTMHLMDLKDMCLYCAKDSHFTYHLYEWQRPQIEGDPHLMKGFHLFHDGMLSFCRMMENGFRIDEERLIKNEMILEKKIVKLQYNIKNCPEIDKWYENRDTEFNYSSGKQLSDFLFNILRLPKTKKTGGDQYSTEAKELKDIAPLSEFLKMYLELAKLIKLTQDLKGVRREMVEGHIYPMFSLNIPKSYRGSSQNPNWQNQSQHDPFAAEMSKSFLMSSEGNRIIGADASSLEVGVGCSVHHDKTMLKQLEEGLDMHLGLAEKLFMGELSQVSKDMIEIKKEMGNYDAKNDTEAHMWKDLRYIGKNGMSFSLQFGDIYLSIGPTVYNKHLQEYHKQYFKESKIDTEKKFTEHIKTVCDWYWEDNYGEFGQWRKDNWKNYVKNMRTKLATGFYSTTVMNRNQCNNYVIQGPAFHLILQAQTKIQEYIDKNKLKTKIVAQIHDAIYFDTPEDLSEWIGKGLREKVVYYMTTYLMKKHRWVIHTMKADVEYYDNGNWYDHIYADKDWDDEKKEAELIRSYGYEWDYEESA